MYLSDSAAPEEWKEEEKWTEEEERWEEEHTQTRRSEGGNVCRNGGEGEEADADAGGGLWRGGMGVRWLRQWGRGWAGGGAGCGTAGRGSGLGTTREGVRGEVAKQKQHNNNN